MCTYISRATLGILLVLFLHGCAGPRPTTVEPPPGIVLSEICSQYNVSWTWDGVTQVVILEHKGNKAKALVGSPVVLIGKEKIILSAPLRRHNSTIYVPDDFESKVLGVWGIKPGAAGLPVDWSRMKVRTVIIDPGHGGKDPGAKGFGGVKEKNVVLDISKRLRILLEEAGIKVIMTRSSDVFVTLPKRTEIATATDADLFVSIHANSNPARKTQGIEVYYVKTSGKRDLDEEERQKNEKSFVRRLKAQYTPVISGIVTDMMYTLKTAESPRLASRIVRDGSIHMDTPNRGARPCRFFVVRNTLIPAVLVEVGYLTNRHEEKKLGAAAYRQRMAETIARSIINYASDS